MSANNNNTNGSGSERNGIDGVIVGAVWTLAGVELAIHPLTLVIAALNFKVVFQTAVVHRNLRWILMVQSVLIAWWSCTQCWMLVGKLVAGDFQGSPGPMFSMLDSFAAQYLSLLSHILLAERVLATLGARWYEQSRRVHWFSALWFIPLTTYMVADCVMIYVANLNVPRSNNVPVQIVILNTTMTGITFLEILVITKLGLYNARKYAQSVFYSGKKRSLSERYQLSENIRTLRQLGPLFCAHFVQLTAFMACGYVLLFRLFSPLGEALFLQVYFLVLALGDLAIVVAVNAFHPALRQRWSSYRSNLRRHLLRLWCNCFGGKNEGSNVVEPIPREQQHQQHPSYFFYNNNNQRVFFGNPPPKEEIQMSAFGGSAQQQFPTSSTAAVGPSNGNNAQNNNEQSSAIMDKYFRTLEQFWAVPPEKANLLPPLR